MRISAAIILAVDRIRIYVYRE